MAIELIMNCKKTSISVFSDLMALKNAYFEEAVHKILAAPEEIANFFTQAEDLTALATRVGNYNFGIGRGQPLYCSRGCQ